jgi:hypothetical protein
MTESVKLDRNIYDSKYEKSRKDKKRLSGYLDDEDAEILAEASKEFSGDKAGVVGALKFWNKYKDKV